jgi:probable F420-dependent oxidoreductase
MPRPLRVGIQLPEVERDVRWPEYARMARGAEAAGFDSIWLGDHLLYRDDGGPERGPWEAWTLLAALAAITERVAIGPLVSCVGFHNPGMLAKLAANVDEISGGRLVFGVGAGWNRAEFDAFGYPYDHRVSRFEEAFAILRPLLAGDRVTFHGDYWHAQDLVLLPEPARRVPIMVGSNAPRMLSITLPHADSWNTWYDDYGNTVEGFVEINDRISDAAREAGRALGDIERSVCVAVSLPGAVNDRPYDKDIAPLEGPSDRIAEHLRLLAEAGANEAILVANPITSSTIRILGDVVGLLDR